MTLAITYPPGIGQEAEQAAHSLWDTIDEVELHLTILGFAPMEKPDFKSPEINAQLYKALSEGDGRMLTYLHAQFSAWYSYALSREGQVKSRIRQFENEMKDIRLQLRRQLIAAATTAAEKKPTGDVIEQEAHLNPRYRELWVELQKYEQMQDELAPHVKKYSAGTRVTSRAVEVRRQELESLNGGGGYRRQDE